MGRTQLTGNSVDILPTLPPASVQLVVTSPPYWSLKDYGQPEQIGWGDTYPEYLSGLDAVWRGCERVLEPGCRLCVNIGDQFLRASENDGVYEIKPLHADIIQQVLQIPGMTFLGSIIWRKISNTQTSGGGTWMGSIYYPRDGYVTYEHEYILIFKKQGIARKPNPEDRERSRLTKEQRSLWFRGMWDLAPASQQEGHPARFPIALPERLIRMFTFYGETVLDPFSGSGTTLDAAELTGRHGIGIELNPVYSHRQPPVWDLL